MSKFIANAQFHLSQWCAQPIRHLAYFEHIRDFFASRPNEFQLRFKCYCLGNLYQTHDIPLESVGYWGGLRDWINTVQRAREIATHFDVNPPFPDKLNDDDADTVDEIYWLMGKGDAPARTRGLTITTFMERSSVARLLNETVTPISGRLNLNFDAREVELFGAKLNLGEIKVSMTSMAVVSSSEELLRAMDKADEHVPVNWQNTPETTYTVTPLSHSFDG